MKYPIGIQSFDRIRNEGYVYVDKTALIYQLVTTGSIYFLSRPRRFGKSLLVSTLEHYFLGHKELFKGLAMELLEQDWLEYPVFHMDFNNTQFEKSGNLENKINIYLTAWEQIYGALPVKGDLGDRFAYVLEQAHKQTGRRAVVLIDEYDKPLLDVLDSGRMTIEDGQEILLEEQHRNILKGFYSVFKGADAHLQFVLLTGVTKFSQVSVFSGFNQPKDLSMHPAYDTLCGITKDELYSYFAEQIQELAQKKSRTEEQIKQDLKRQYDGYHFSPEMRGVYNPFSLLNCFDTMRMEDYWFKSGTPTYLVRLLSHTQEQLNDMVGQYYFPEEFVDYKATVEQPLPMIYQSGYLTIKDYDPEMNSFLLDFPNNEVKKGFLTLVATSYLQPQERIISWIQQAVKALRQGKIEQFRDQLTAFLASVPYSMRRKQDEREYERYFHYTFYLLLRLLSVYMVYSEKEQSQGRVDCIVETSNYVYIFEFKLDGSAEQALQQIQEKGYAKPYLTDPRKLYQIGVNFSSETGTIEGFKIELRG